MGSSCIEKGWGSMSEPTLSHQVIGFGGRFNVVFVDTNSNSHQQVLWSFYNLSINLQKVGPFKSFEAKIIIFKIPVIEDLTVQPFSILIPMKALININI